MLSLLLDRPRAARIEKRATKSTGMSLSSDAFLTAFGRTPTLAGPTINESTALTISVVFCAFDLRANALSMCPHKMYQRTADGGREEATDDHRYGIIHTRPNKWMRAKRFRWLMSFWRDTWGNAYAEMEVTKGGRLLYLNPIHPANVRIRIEGDQVLYDVVNSKGGTRTLTSERMWHWPGPSDDGIRGLSLVGLARQSLGYSVAAEEYGARFMRNNAMPGLMFQSEHKWDNAAKALWLKNFQTAYAGDEMGSAMISDEGLKPVPIGTMPMKDAQFIELRQFQVLDFCRYTHIPAHKMMNMESATFGNIEHQAIEYVGDAIQPIAESFAESIDGAIFDEDEELLFYTEVNLDGLLKGDSVSRATALQIQRQNGIINGDQWCALENRNKLPDGQGEIYIAPSNMQSLKQLKKLEDQPLPDPNQPKMLPTGNKSDEKPPEKDEKEDDSRSFECLKPCFLDAFQRLFVVESDQIPKLRKKQDAEKCIDEWCIKRRDALESALLPVLNGLSGHVDDVPVSLAGIAARHIERLRRDALAGRMETEDARRAFAESEWEALV